MISLDFSSLENKTFDQIRKAVCEATGLPLENIILSCTHQHSSPEPNSDESYAKYMVEKIAEGAQKAIEDLTPATIAATICCLWQKPYTQSSSESEAMPRQ